MASVFLQKKVQKFPEYLMFIIFSLSAVLQTGYMLTLGCTDCKLCYSSQDSLARGMIESPVSKQLHYFFTVTMYFFCSSRLKALHKMYNIILYN